MDGGVGPQIWRLAANILNKESWTADQELGGFGVRLKTLCYKNQLSSEISYSASELDPDIIVNLSNSMAYETRRFNADMQTSVCETRSWLIDSGP